MVRSPRMTRTPSRPPGRRSWASTRCRLRATCTSTSNARTWALDAVADTARRARASAQIEPEDADVVELHDALTIGEIGTIEAPGLSVRVDGNACVVAVCEGG